MCASAPCPPLTSSEDLKRIVKPNYGMTSLAELKGYLAVRRRAALSGR